MTSFPDLFPGAETLFKDLVCELAEYGIDVDPRLELRRVVATISYYDFDDGHIYLGLPNPAHAVGRLAWLMGRSVWCCDSDDELARFLEIFIPRLVAHELGHHLRHRYGTLTADRWREEQVANQLATAVMNRRLSHDDRANAIRLVRRALDHARGTDGLATAATYHDVLAAFHAEGLLADQTVGTLEALQSALALSPEAMLTGQAMPSDDVVSMLAKRSDAIEQINSEYVSDQMQYLKYHLAWLYYDLTSRRTATIDEFARMHLGLGDVLLDSPATPIETTVYHIRACHQAHVASETTSPTASRYFYKRYRALLMSALRFAHATGANGPRFDGWIGSMLEGWSDDPQDPLEYLSAIAPEPLKALLPQHIATSDDQSFSDDALPTETDRRLWRHVRGVSTDSSAHATLERLALLDRSSVFEHLPADVMLQIAASLSRVRVREGETVVWAGDQNSDVYVIADGELSILINVVGRLRQIGKLRAGDVFGDMAFVTGKPRSATVRASTNATCFVLGAADLRALAFQHPIILMQMARSLATRLQTSSASQKTLV